MPPTISHQNYPAHEFSRAAVAVALLEESGTVNDDDC
jgi:hypothetical protein